MTIRRSIHFGLNAVNPGAYAGWSGKLQGCENDARAMRDLFFARGFDARPVLGPAVTRSQVTQAIGEAAQVLVAGDTLAVTFAGHGSQVPNLTQDDDEQDKYDETWCLFDGQMLDDELRMLWSRFAVGVRLLLISDSCHSETIHKVMLRLNVMPDRNQLAAAVCGPKAAGLPRSLDPGGALKTYLANRPFYDGIRTALPYPRPELKCCLVLMSACLDTQQAYEAGQNGRFTSALARAWRQGAFVGTYEEWLTATKAEVGAYQTPGYRRIGVPDDAFTKGQALAN